jgi:hypothetical protein
MFDPTGTSNTIGSFIQLPKPLNEAQKGQTNTPQARCLIILAFRISDTATSAAIRGGVHMYVFL